MQPTLQSFINQEDYKAMQVLGSMCTRQLAGQSIPSLCRKGSQKVFCGARKVAVGLYMPGWAGQKRHAASIQVARTRPSWLASALQTTSMRDGQSPRLPFFVFINV
jgi:hypothetical protein